MSEVCQIIGVLDNGMEGLIPEALSAIQQADLVIGGHRTLSLFEASFKSDVEKKDLTGQLKHLPEWIRHALDKNLKVIVLATGDPLCHGIAPYLINKLGAYLCRVIPNTSTIQLAFTRLGIAWQNVCISSIHGKDTGEWDEQADHRHGLYPLLRACQYEDLLAVFTSPENTPSRIARLLKHEGLGNSFAISVAEKLLTDEERVHKGLTVDEVSKMDFLSPNLVILQRLVKKPEKILFGLDEGNYAQRKPDKGLITKTEVRAVSLAKMQLKNNSIIWDIGAGSGSVGLEAARLCPAGYVYAIEKNQADAAIIRQNKQQLGVYNYKIVHAKAPDYLHDWPNPDAIFIGGTGGELSELIRLCLQRLKQNGHLVMNLVTFENLNTAIETLKQLKAHWNIIQLQASRSQPILNMQRMQAQNPVWILCAHKQGVNNE